MRARTTRRTSASGRGFAMVGDMPQPWHATNRRFQEDSAHQPKGTVGDSERGRHRLQWRIV